MFSGPVKATHLIKRHYADGSFFHFYVCSNCLSILVKDADKYDVQIDVKEVADAEQTV